MNVDVGESAQASWMSLGLVIVPWLALIVSFGSAWFSRQTYRLNRKQALERQPQLDFNLENLWLRRREAGARQYELALLITNRSATANTVVAAELIVTLALSSAHELRLRVPVTVNADAQSPPIRLDSHGSIAAKFIFVVPAGMVPTGAKVKSHQFEFIDTSGETYVVKPTLVSERRDDVSQNMEH